MVAFARKTVGFNFDDGNKISHGIGEFKCLFCHVSHKDGQSLFFFFFVIHNVGSSVAYDALVFIAVSASNVTFHQFVRTELFWERAEILRPSLELCRYKVSFPSWY